MSLILNALIFGITALLLLLTYLRSRKGEGMGLKKAFRFFTVQSNAFCGLAALCMCLAPKAQWSWLLKYMATAAVSLTMLTVFFYLAPMVGLKKLLEKDRLFMHLLTPLMALASFCIWERRGLPGALFLLGLVPVVLYVAMYLKKVIFTKGEKAWDDLYAFNRKGKWPISLLAMLTATFLICLGLKIVQNAG